MEDAISHSSLDSAADEFVVVNAEPKLKIANNGDADELRSKLSEVLHDDTGPPGGSSGDKMSEKVGATECVTQDTGSTAPESGGGDDVDKTGGKGPEEAADPKTGKGSIHGLTYKSEPINLIDGLFSYPFPV